MHRYEGFAQEILGHLDARDASVILDALDDADLVKLLAGSNAATDRERYVRNVVTTELLNRVEGKQALLMESLDVDNALDALSLAGARALRADLSCLDEVRGAEFALHGRNRLPEGFREVSRCRQTSMPLCRHVAETGEPLRVADIPASPQWEGTPAWRRFRIRSYAGAPGYGADGNVLAVAWVACYRARAFNDAEMALLSRVARRVAQTLERRDALVRA